MVELLPEAEMLLAFIVASLVLAVTPGPSVLYIVARSATQGRRAGLVSVAGIAAGGWCNAIGASVGLATIFLASSMAFTLVKWVGAAYLVYLGVQLIRRAAVQSEGTDPPAIRAKRIFRDGFVVALFNPKTTMFFAAFLPQFMTDGPNPVLQAMLLSTLCVLIAAGTDTIYAVVAGSASGVLSRSTTVTRAGNVLNGAVFIGLAIYTALGGSRSRAN